MKTIGIIPAVGWNAVFMSENGKETTHYPVAAWVLLEGKTEDGDSYRSFTGVMVMGDGPMEIDEMTNHQGYEPIGGWGED